MGKPFWDVEESIGFVKIKSNIDSLEYKVYDIGSESEKQETADNLAKVRRLVNKILFYLCRNPEIWIHDDIALGIFLTLEIHIPCISKTVDLIIRNTKDDDNLSDIINNECIKMKKLFSIQEMTPNKHGIFGLNKPKGTKIIKIDDSLEYEVATKRSFHLTIRKLSLSNDEVIDKGMLDYDKSTIPLVLHELTHTTCNDNYWKDDNHQYPFNKYHNFIKNIFSIIK